MRRQKDRKMDYTQRMVRYNAADVNGKLIINFRNISHTMRFLYEGKGSQKRILIVLLETGRITQRALTKRLDIQPGSASEVIAKLENAGLIVRTSSTEDRRTTDVSLTEEGKKQAIEISEQRDRRHERMFSCLSETEKMQLLTLLEKVNSDWEQRYQNIAKKDEVTDYRHGPHAHRSREDRSERRE